jgi:hypothetical protein
MDKPFKAMRPYLDMFLANYYFKLPWGCGRARYSVTSTRKKWEKGEKWVRALFMI